MRSYLFKTLGLILFIFFYSNLGFSQTTYIRKNAISTNGVSVFMMTSDIYYYDISYERVLTNKFTLSSYLVGGVYSYTSNYQGSFASGRKQLGGWGFSLEGRTYPFGEKKHAPWGIFLGAYYRHYFLNEKTVEQISYYQKIVTNDKQQAWGVGADIGYKFGRNRFMFEPLVGYAINWSNTDLSDGERLGMFLRIEGRLGVAF